MSAATGPPLPPNQPPGGSGLSNKATNDDDTPPWPNDKAHNGHSDWNKNVKVKTCKCRLCGERVKKYSWKCSKCGLHICSECAEEDGASDDSCKYIAQNNLTKLCNCFYPSRQAPELHNELLALGLQHVVPNRDRELEEGRRIKRELKERREALAQAQSTAQGDRARKSHKATSKIDQESATPESPDESPLDDSDDVYESITTTAPTIATQKPLRKGTTGKHYRDSSSEGPSPKRDIPDTDRHQNKRASYHGPRKAALPQPAPTYRNSPVSHVQTPSLHLHGGDTVILGAGIAGLCVAHELATMVERINIDHRITVVEIRDGYGELASGHCSGLLSIHNMPRPLNALSGLSTEVYAELVASPGFNEAVDFRQNSVYDVARLSGKGRKNKPSWYGGHDADSFVDDKWTMGKLDTKKLCSWLYEQCLELGVDFVFHHEVSGVFHMPGQDASAVELRDCHDRTKARETIRCHNVVFAAGPWTTEVFKHMYGKSTLKLENHVQLAYSYRLQNASMSPKDDVGLLFPELAEADEALDDKITMVGQTSNNTVIVTGVGSETKNTMLSALEARDPVLGEARPLRHLKRIAAKRLNDEDKDVLNTNNVDRNFSFISTSDQKYPIIDKVPTSGLGRVCTGDEDKRPCGIWLCFGFGMYGTTLAPGAARALCRRMFGEKSGIDDVNFAIPLYTQPSP